MNTNPRASALMKTLRAFQAVMLALTLVTMSFPVTAITANAQEDTTPPAEEVVVEEAAAPEEEAPATGPIECAEGQELNEAGDACVDVVVEETPAPEAAARTTDTVNQIDDYTYDDETEDDMCVVVSDTYTIEGGQPAVIVSNPHSGWTAVLASISKWIWGEDPTTLTAGTEVETFTRTFSIDEVPTGATLRVAADNGYSVTVNGHAVGADSEEHNYQAGHEDDYVIPAANLLEGENTLTFVVTNQELSGETPSTNPAGLRYVLTVEGADCGRPFVPENSCVAPSTLETTGTQTFGGSEESLQHILDNASPAYSVDADDDQTNIQQWNGSGNNVDFSVKFIKKIAADKHVFGYVQNGGAFVPVFKDDASIGGVYAAIPVQSAGPFNFTLSGVNDVVFAIHDVSSNTFYYTKNSLNTSDNKQHAVVYNSDDNEYVIAFEDLPNQGDKDFNDLVVEVTVTDCEAPEDSITVVATKIVCENESDLPNVMGGNHVTDANTAANFLATHSDSCRVVPDWQFQWANNGPDGGNATIGPVAGYTTSGLTAANGTVSMTIPLVGGDEIHLREVLKSGYIPFKGGTSDNVSAEFACANDGLNYDNWDFIRNPVEGNTYYCVAWNVEEENETPTCNPEENLIANGGFEAPVVGAGTYSIVPDTNPLLEWLVAWTSPEDGGTLGLEIQDHVAGDPASGAQHAELDGDHPVTISQEIATVPGQEYTINFKYSARAGRATADNSIVVKADGAALGAVVEEDGTGDTNTDWHSYFRTFTADSATTVIEFADTGTDTSYGGYLDDVSVSCVAPDNGEDTAETIVVRLGDLESNILSALANDKWFEYNDSNDTIDNTLGSFVTGPATAPLGTGSIQFTLAPNPQDRKNIATYQYGGTKLADITSLKFSAYSVSGVAGPTESPYLVMNVDFNNLGTWQKRLVYVPANNGAVPQDAWNTYDAVNGGSANWVYSGATWPAGIGEPGTTPGTTAKTWAQLLSTYPNIKIAVNNFITTQGLLGVRVGEPGPDGYTGAVDKFVIGVQTGADTHTTTYDFEPNEDDGCYDEERDVRVDCGGGDDDGRLVIIKEVDGEDASFDFDIVAGEFFADADVTTTEGSGSTEVYLSEGTYDVTESVFEGWTLDSVTCEYDGESEGVDIANGERIYIEEGETVTCTFHNTQDEQFDGPSSRSGSGRGRSGGSSGDGEVLGASTCSALLTDYLKMGWDNNPAEVIKLQEFLNAQVGSTLPLTGLFGPATYEAVKLFQKNYWEQVLKPWVGLPGSGIEGENTPTGFVYQTTRWHINNIWCPGSEAFPQVLN